MERVPKKNISGLLTDVRHPGRAARPPFVPKRVPVFLAKSVRAARPARWFDHAHLRLRPRIGRMFLWGVLAVFLAASTYAALLYREKEGLSLRSALVAEAFRDSVKFFSEFKLGEAKRSLESADRELRGIRSLGERYGVWSIADIGGEAFSALRQFPEAFRLVETLTRSALAIAEGAENLKANGMSYFTSGAGWKLLSELQKIRVNVGELREAGQDLTSLSGVLESFVSVPVPGNYLAWNTELLRVEELLEGVIALLGSPGERHVLLFFHNPSEMRPGGGFIGSYADVTIVRGAMQELDVRDIYDPDGQLDLKVIPPRPLQSLTTDWGARDANWFFDFPTSAQKVIGFLEASKMYAERALVFEGAVGINTDVIESLLEIVGPIELPAYDLTVNAENFLAEVQREVETGEAKHEGEPKRIIRDITPLLLSRLEALDEEGKQALIARAAEHLAQGDIVFYFRDRGVQNFVLARDLGGAVADLPRPFIGDYLAVVNANVAGGKTDVFMRQNVTVQSSIDPLGVLATDLLVARTHTGAKARESWYRATNRNYLRFLVHPDAKLVLLAGDTPRTLRARTDYEKSGYRADPDLLDLETNERESGKKAIGAWLDVKAGATGTLRARYENIVPLELKDGGRFTVILEQQPGVRGSVHYELEAPTGFAWLETGNSRYVYDSENPPKRVTVTLTLKKL